VEQYLNIALFITLAYLIGSFSTAIVTCKIMGLEDPRDTGSNNPGATNVLRHGGKKAAIITLIGDMLKGLIPVLLVQQLSSESLVVALVGFFALLGHIFPV
jgi:glycerol-3-phosphate acyltransferase PlsY